MRHTHLMRLATRSMAVGAVLALGSMNAGCSDQAEERGVPTSPPETSTAVAPPTEPSTPMTTASTPTAEDEPGASDTIVHFTAGDSVVEVTIDEDTPTARDFLSMLPMTLPFEDYAGMEKITYPERAFDYTDAEGMTPEVGDLFSYRPWGNLGFFYDTGTLGYSDQLVLIGTTADLDAVMELDGQDVTITIVD